MSDLIRGKLDKSSVRDLAKLRDRIELDPDYQRAGDIWSLPRRQLLIDSILNDFDVPKLYFRALVPAQEQEGRLIAYSVIDGRQRLEALWAFLDGELTLADDADIDGLDELPGEAVPDFVSLQTWHPRLVDRFLNYQLDVVTIETEDIDVVEDMFLRLNESSALNAAEKRNAFGGPLPSLARALAGHEFFTHKLPYANRRYRHYDIATKFLYFERRGGVADTKKAYLDRFVRGAREIDRPSLEGLKGDVEAVLEDMGELFATRDPLLTAVGMASVYYLVVRQAAMDGWLQDLRRDDLERFEEARRENKRIAARGDESDADYDLLEFDRYAQSPNDAVALRFRRDVLLKYLDHPLEAAGEDGD